MPSISTDAPTTRHKLGGDYWKFLTGQTISSLGGAFTIFALPLLVFKLTGSAFALGVTAAVVYLPYLFFGLIIGALVDRANRRRVMIVTDLARTVVIATIPLLAALGLLSIWWIYIVAFIQTTLGIFFESCEFAAIPSLVAKDDLIAANGRIQASYSAGRIFGPLLAGALVIVLPVSMVLLGDALSFLISALTLLSIRRSFNAAPDQAEQPAEPAEPAGPTGVRAYLYSLSGDITAGLRYIFGNPLLRSITLMMVLINFVYCPVFTQIVFFARHQLTASDPQIGWFFSASGIGIIALSLVADRVRKHWSFSMVALGVPMLMGLLIITFSFLHSYWIALLIWAAIFGLSTLYNINDVSLRQAIVPNEMLGRVITVENSLSWSVIPLGTFLGGLAIQLTHNVALIYAACGTLILLVAIAFVFTALAHADRYLPASQPASAPATVGE